jgi:CRP-like cAMP-binding protein
MPQPEPGNLSSRSNGDRPIAANRKNGANHGTPVELCSRLFSGILPADFTAICRLARVKQFDRGEMLHLEGDAVDRVIMVTSGSVKLTKMSQAGDEVILRLAAPGDILSVEGLIWCGLHCTTAEVFRSCQTLIWDPPVFKNLIERYPVLHQNMVVILGEHLRELEERFREVATGKVGPRVALQLLRLLESIGRPVDAGVEIGLSREELAQMTGTTLFTVSRLLSAWEARGVVKPRREAVAVCDVESLHALALDE